MRTRERPLLEGVKHGEGEYGGFCFGGQWPDGVTAFRPLPRDTVFPNGARAALLLTFDVEGTYGNGTGDMMVEIENYRRITERLRARRVPATFHIVGRMAEEHGPEFVRWMLEAGGEVALHGYVHDLNKRYGGDRTYAGHYGLAENRAQIRDALAVLRRIPGARIRGVRLPYAHFNEYSYRAIREAGLVWSSHVGIDDFLVPGQGAGGSPFLMQLGPERYPVVEIPLDTQTFDWPIWIADESSNGAFVAAVRTYCNARSLPFERTPAGGVPIWFRRMQDAIEARSVFTFLCHPINFVVHDPRWGDPVDEFLFPVIDRLGALRTEGKAWVCTCGEMADFYLQHTPGDPKTP